MQNVQLSRHLYSLAGASSIDREDPDPDWQPL